MYRRNTKNITFGILAVLVSVVAVGLAYAGFSQTLNITSTGTVKSVNWDIYFANLSSASLTGTANLVSNATISGKTTIGNYSVTFATPGDSLTYTFDVTNQGDFNASLSSLTKTNPSCTPVGSSATNVCKNLTYTLKYTSNNQNVAQTDTLNVGETKNMTLKLVYNANTPANELPSEQVTVGGLGITLLYTQVGSYVEPTPVANTPAYLYTSTEQHIGDTLTVNGTTVFNNFEDAKYNGNNFTTAHIVDGSNQITESYVAFKVGDTIYYLKGYDTSAYQDNLYELNIAFPSSTSSLWNNMMKNTILSIFGIDRVNASPFTVKYDVRSGSGLNAGTSSGGNVNVSSTSTNAECYVDANIRRSNCVEG